MTDITDELKRINSILNVLHEKIERIEGQTAYCVSALMDYDPLSQDDEEDFGDDNNNNNDDDEVPPSYASISSSTTKDV